MNFTRTQIESDLQCKMELLGRLEAKGGYLDSKVLCAADVAALADLPAKPVLQAMLLGVMQAPARNLVTVLNAKVATIVNVINAYKDKVQNAN